MYKQYAPVKVKNPVKNNCLIRLLDGQNIDVVFDSQLFNEHRVHLVSDFLSIVSIREIANGWMASIEQNERVNEHKSSTLYLGNVNFYDKQNTKTASLCVVTNNENHDFLKIINPKNNICQIEPNQILEIVLFTDSATKRFSPLVVGSDLLLEQLQYCVKCPSDWKKQPKERVLFEHCFKFRYTSESIKILSEQSYGKYEGGSIAFFNAQIPEFQVHLVCNWRGKNSIFKALLFPKIPTCQVDIIKKSKKQIFETQVSLKKIKYNKLEDGCNVVLSKGV